MTDEKNEAEIEKSLGEQAQKLGETALSSLTNAGKFILDPGNLTKIGSGLKTLTVATTKLFVKSGINLLSNPKKAMHTALGITEKAVNAIPFIGGALSFFFGTGKDALLDAKIEELSTNIGKLQEGLQSLADSVGQALNSLQEEMRRGFEELGARQDQLEGMMVAFAQEQDKINRGIQQKISDIQDKLTEHEKKLQVHRDQIFSNQIKIEDTKAELKDKIRVAETNLENFRK